MIFNIPNEVFYKTILQDTIMDKSVKLIRRTALIELLVKVNNRNQKEFLEFLEKNNLINYDVTIIRVEKCQI